MVTQYMKVLVPSQQSSEEPPAAQPEDNADDITEASTASPSRSFSWSPVQSDTDEAELLNPELVPSPTPGPDIEYCSLSPEELPADIGTTFKDLLSACGQRSFTTFERLFKSISSEEGDEFEKIADGKNSEVFRVNTYTGDSVLKMVELDDTPELRDRLLSEIKIASRLTDLREGREYFTNGFVELKSVKCVFDSYPGELLRAREEAAGNLQKRRGGNESDRMPRAYLVWHMAYAGVPLDQIELDNELQLWSVLHQMALSLAVAEEALEFEHRALWLRRVFVKRHVFAEQTSHYTIGGRSHDILTWGVETYIAGLTTIFSAIKNDPRDSIEPAVRSVNRDMEKIIRNDWSGFHPLTNLLWVLHVTKELRRRYKRKFSGSSRNDFEQMAWSEIGSWKQQLLECPSLAEFIEKQCDNNPLS
ncbi:hypothetical protein HPB50_016712 [Hyalomma asiaticum]|uniref:Uncharacterized protein n=1 Tax=Hyalomma asiaticum TaxID=266040 RepID=A0ACB7S3G0_HYAAI|nr:hypothetical protein HPB50_016712 [Hyalomma asiaticum]